MVSHNKLEVIRELFYWLTISNFLYIIVLIILAGISINLVLGENGIIQKAKNAAIESQKAQYFEELQMDIAEAKIQMLSDTEKDLVTIMCELIEKRDWVEKVEIYDDSQDNKEETKIVITTRTGRLIMINVNNTNGDIIIDEEYGLIEDLTSVIVTYVKNDDTATGSMNTQTVLKGFSITLANCEYSKDNYLFIGWSRYQDGKDENGTNDIHLAGTRLKIEGDTILYAQWLEIDSLISTAPTIQTNMSSSSGTYPLITEYGIVMEDECTVTITYNNNEGLKNLYSLDEGKTWNEYTGPITTKASNIQAKSVLVVNENISTEVANITVNTTLASDAIGAEAYDNGNDKDDTAFFTTLAGETHNYYISIDPSMIGKRVRIKQYALNNPNWKGKMYFIDSDGNKLSFMDSNNISYTEFAKTVVTDDIFIIPQNAAKIKFTTYNMHDTDTANTYIWRIYDIAIANEPIINKEGEYPILKSSGISIPKIGATITYDGTSVQKFYKVGNDEEWNIYTDNQFIELNVGQTLYAKGIDKYGKETRIVSQYTQPELTTYFIGTEAYDTGDDKDETAFFTTLEGGSHDYYISIDSSMLGKKVRIKQYALNNPNWKGRMYFIDYNGNTLSFTDSNNNSYTSFAKTVETDDIFIIPQNAAKIKFTTYNMHDTYIENTYIWRLYDISPVNE